MRAIIMLIAILFLSSSAQASEKKIVTITCYQNGQEIIREENLRNYSDSQGILYGQKLDGTWIIITGLGGGTLCKIADYKEH